MRSSGEWVAALKETGSDRQRRAFEELGELLYRRVLGYLLRRQPTNPSLSQLDRQELRQLAYDQVQEALATIYEKLDTYRGEGGFTAWATRIALNVARMDLRRPTPIPVPLFDDQPSHEEAASEGYLTLELEDTSAVPPEKALVQQEVWAVLQQVVAEELTENQRRAFLWRYEEGWTYETIAQELGVTRNRAYGLVFEARQRIKSRLVASGFTKEIVLDAFM